MANHDRFNDAEIMYPPVPVTGDAPQPIMPYTGPPAMPTFGGTSSSGPELLTGGFNQTWLLNCLRRRWLLALLMGSFLGAATVGLLMFLVPVSSSVSAVLHVQEEQTNLLENKKNFSPKELEVFQETQAALLKTQFILQTALSPGEIAQLPAVVKEEPDPVSWLQEELQVGFKGKTLFLRIDSEEDSEDIKKVMSSLINAYKKEVIGTGIERSGETYGRMADLHRQFAKELSGKINEYDALREEFGGAETVGVKTELQMLVNEIRQVQMQIQKAEESLSEEDIQWRVNQQQLSSQSAVDQAISEALDKDPTLVGYQQEQFAMTQRIRMLKAASKTGVSAEIKRLESSLRQSQQEASQYEAQLRAEMRESAAEGPREVLATLRTEYLLRRGSTVRVIKELTEKLEELRENVKSKGDSSPDLAVLESEIAQLQEIVHDLDYRLRSRKFENQNSDELFRVLQPPLATEQINSIQRLAIAALGGIAAFFATCYGVALIEFRRRRLNGASDMDEGMGVRVLGVLPSVSSRKAMASGGLLAAQISESIDNVRATLMHDSTSQKRQVVLVTSPATMEGTTTVASHLALSLTRAGRRTLLVDGDIREPALHKLFGMPLEEGFSEVLRSDMDVTDAVRPTNTEGLWLLTAGHCDMDAVHALATDQPQPIFEKLREEFDFIIIDGAPVLGLSDSISLGQHVDGVVLTVLRDYSEVRKVYQAIELLKDMGIRLLGSVVNGVSLKADRRIVQLHKNAHKKTPKLTEATKKVEEPKASAESAVETKVAEPTEELANNGIVEEPANGVMDDFEMELNEEIEIDFDDLGLDDAKE